MRIWNIDHSYEEKYIGDEVWAYAYKPSTDKCSKRFYQPPILGKLMAGETEIRHKAAIEQYLQNYPCANTTDMRVEYFVPYKANHKDLAWSKAVRVGARDFALTYDESKIKYNKQVTDYIKWLETEIAEVKALII